MTAAILDEPTTRPEGYPFHIGYRYVHSTDADGKKVSTQVPLTEEDFLHPQEEDRFMAALEHTAALRRLMNAIDFAGRGRAATGLFGELRIDWQVPGVLPHGPDVVVFDRLPDGLAPNTGTLFVADLGLTPIVVFEVTSPETRHVDLGAKFDEYRQVGVPIYLVIDLAAPNDVPAVLGFELADGRFREMAEDPLLGYRVPGLNMWFRLQNRQIVAATDAGDIPMPAELGLIVDGLSDEVDRIGAEADAERQRAEAANARADAEKARAEAAQRLADALEETAAAAIRRADAAARAVDIADEIARTAKQIADAADARAEAATARAEAAQERIDAMARELAELKARLASNG